MTAETVTAEKLSQDAIIRFILNHRFQLKLYGVPRSKWRERVAIEFCKRYPGNADGFIEAWETLAGKNILWI